MTKRISRGTPYVLNQGDVENYLASVTPRTEQAIAALLGMEVQTWRDQTKAMKVKQILDFQNSGVGAATLAAAAKAQRDLEEVAFGPTEPTPEELDEAKMQRLAEILLEKMTAPTTPARRTRKGA